MGNVGNKDYCRNDLDEIRMSDDTTHRLDNYVEKDPIEIIQEHAELSSNIDDFKRSYYCVVESDENCWYQNNTIEGIKCSDGIINELEQNIDFYTKNIHQKIKKMATNHSCKWIENEILKCYNNKCNCNLCYNLKQNRLEVFDKCIKENVDKILQYNTYNNV